LPTFLQIKVYRRKFLQYALVLLVLCIGLGYLLCGSVIRGRVAANREETVRTFNRMESEIERTTESIERYVLQVYNSSALLQDMLYFMGNDMEGYLSTRLDGGSFRPLASFVDSVYEFAASENNEQFLRISLHDESTAAVFLLDAAGSSLTMQVPNTDPLLQTNISQGIVYVRTLVSPYSLYTTIGEFQFVMNSRLLFASALEYDLPNMVVMDDEGGRYTIREDSAWDGERLYGEVLKMGYNQGEMRSGVNTLYYTMHTSTKNGYHFISGISLGAIVYENATLLLGIVGVLLLVYCVTMVLIAFNMRYDAAFLQRIIATIGGVKDERFEPIQYGARRKNEYAMIAQELNDMVAKLEEHIRTEYKLKLKQQETEMIALQHQINPHFLHNTLETIRSCAIMGQLEAVSDAITNLGKMYRSVVKSDLSVTMGEEMELLNAYLEIMALRYSGSFAYHTGLEKGMLELETVKFWMQPLAENFFIHGYDKSSEYNLFVLNGWEEAERYVIEMTDNGSAIEPSHLEEINATLGKPSAKQEGIGLKNVYARLRYFYGDDLEMSLRNNSESGITITIFIPKEVASRVQVVDR